MRKMTSKMEFMRAFIPTDNIPNGVSERGGHNHVSGHI